MDEVRFRPAMAPLHGVTLSSRSACGGIEIKYTDDTKARAVAVMSSLFKALPIVKPRPRKVNRYPMEDQ